MKFHLTAENKKLAIKILNPFVLTRLILLWVSWFSAYFTRSITYPLSEVVYHGFIYTHFRFIDVWARWDSGWYLSIIKQGYQPSSDLNGQSNLAFFPLYPLIIKLLASVIPIWLRSDLIIIVIGLVVSNLCLLGSMWLLYQLSLQLFHNEEVAENSLWLLLVFPAGFIFTCFYTESLFLFLSLGCVYLMNRKKFLASGLMGMLASLTRSQGILLIIFPLWSIWILSKQRSLTKTKFGHFAILILFICLGLLIFLGYSQLIFHNWLLPLNSQAAWGKMLTLPWKTIFAPIKFIGFITPVDKWIAIVSLLTSIYLFKVFKNKDYVWYALASILLPLTTGVLHSVTRYVAVIFPLYLGWAYLMKKWKIKKEWIFVSLMTIQTALFIAWCQFYWVM
jgi:Gpi18-like mannosyltransferase